MPAGRETPKSAAVTFPKHPKNKEIFPLKKRENGGMLKMTGGNEVKMVVKSGNRTI